MPNIIFNTTIWWSADGSCYCWSNVGASYLRSFPFYRSQNQIREHWNVIHFIGYCMAYFSYSIHVIVFVCVKDIMNPSFIFALYVNIYFDKLIFPGLPQRLKHVARQTRGKMEFTDVKFSTGRPNTFLGPVYMYTMFYTFVNMCNCCTRRNYCLWLLINIAKHWLHSCVKNVMLFSLAILFINILYAKCLLITFHILGPCVYPVTYFSPRAVLQWAWVREIAWDPLGHGKFSRVWRQHSPGDSKVGDAWTTQKTLSLF